MPRRAAPCRAALRCAVHHALLRSSTGRALRCRCWQGEHVGLGAVAVAVLVLYVVGYPLVTLIHVRSIVPKLDKSIRRRQRWHHFVLADYKASHRRFCWMASSARRSRIGMRARLSDAGSAHRPGHGLHHIVAHSSLGMHESHGVNRTMAQCMLPSALLLRGAPTGFGAGR
jgi:hypothetical protein